LMNEAPTRTMMFDFTDLDNPKYLGHFEYPTTAVDHNLYTRGSKAIAANYSSGIRILDTSNIASGTMNEIGFFDMFPEPQGDKDNSMFGAWSVYPYFESQNIA